MKDRVFAQVCARVRVCVCAHACVCACVCSEHNQHMSNLIHLVSIYSD